MTMLAAEVFTTVLAADPLIPNSKPTPIPGASGIVSTLFGYALWLVVLAGVGACIFGLIKLSVTDKSRGGGGSEPFKWIGGGIAAIFLSGSLIAILNGMLGG